MIGVAISLLVVALMSLAAFAALSGGRSDAGGSQALGATVANAYDVQAQSDLDTVVQNVRSAMVADGGASGLDLSQYGVSIGASTDPQVVSGAVSASDTADAGAPGPGSDGSSVTLAAAAKSGTCWFVWLSGTTTWYGDEPDATTCAAVPLSAPPTPGPSSPGAIGWQQGAFPATG